MGMNKFKFSCKELHEEVKYARTLDIKERNLVLNKSINETNLTYHELFTGFVFFCEKANRNIDLDIAKWEEDLINIMFKIESKP